MRLRSVVRRRQPASAGPLPARNAAGTGRERDRAAVLEAGAEHFAALDAERFEELAGQVDVVLDMIGGDVLDRSAAVVRPDGTLVSVTAPPNVRRLTAARYISWSSRTATSWPKSPAGYSRAG
jgi:NADPH:quinone reductase-like Zn-dependent oxidoreductase